MDSGLHIGYPHDAFSITVGAPFVPETILLSVVCLLTGPGKYEHGMLGVQSKSESSHGYMPSGWKHITKSLLSLERSFGFE